MKKTVTKKDISQKKHSLSRPIIYRLWMGSVEYLPRFLLYGFAERIASICYLLQLNAWEDVKKNLSKVFPFYSEKISSIALNIFRKYGKYLVDYGRFSSLDRDAVFNVIKHIDGDKTLPLSLRRETC